MGREPRRVWGTLRFSNNQARGLRELRRSRVGLSLSQTLTLKHLASGQAAEWCEMGKAAWAGSGVSPAGRASLGAWTLWQREEVMSGLSSVGRKALLSMAGVEVGQRQSGQPRIPQGPGGKEAAHLPDPGGPAPEDLECEAQPAFREGGLRRQSPASGLGWHRGVGRAWRQTWICPPHPESLPLLNPKGG